VVARIGIWYVGCVVYERATLGSVDGIVLTTSATQNIGVAADPGRG
jgi:hypothetical protein